MERKYDEALDVFEETIKAISDTYYLEDCEVEINAAADTLIQTGKDLDTEIDNLRDEIKALKEELLNTQDEVEEAERNYPHVVIRIDSLAVQNKIREFIESELSQFHNDHDLYEFINTL